MTLRDLGRGIVRALPFLESAARRSYGMLPPWLHDTPTRRIARFFASDPIVTFVQVGAYDGLAGDPLRPLILARTAFRGVLVEPQPAAFRALQDNYRSEAPRLTFVNAAIDVEAGSRLLYTVAEQDPKDGALPDWAFEVAAFDEAHVRKHFPRARIEAAPVATVRFCDIAENLPGSCVDLLVVDVEGAERAILDGIDLDRHRIRFTMFEHKHLAPQDLASIVDRLRRAGFALKSFGRDTIAWRRLRDETGRRGGGKRDELRSGV